MTKLEETSKRKAEAIRYCVDRGEYSPGYALDSRLEPLHDNGKILDVDYEPLARYLDELMKQPIEEVVEEVVEEGEGEAE